MIVVLIIAILMAVALPLYLSAVGDSQLKTCRANMQTISTAVQAGRMKAIAKDYSTWVGSDVPTLIAGGKLDDFPQKPVCPLNGTYAIAAGSTGNADSFKVTCTVAAHGTYEPGVNSN